jgi:hypothetical protein
MIKMKITRGNLKEFTTARKSDTCFGFANVAHWKNEDDGKAAIEAGEKQRAGKG